MRAALKWIRRFSFPNAVVHLKPRVWFADNALFVWSASNTRLTTKSSLVFGAERPNVNDVDFGNNALRDACGLFHRRLNQKISKRNEKKCLHQVRISCVITVECAFVQRISEQRAVTAVKM
jgi:hypothetical protein